MDFFNPFIISWWSVLFPISRLIKLSFLTFVCVFIYQNLLILSLTSYVSRIFFYFRYEVFYVCYIYRFRAGPLRLWALCKNCKTGP